MIDPDDTLPQVDLNPTQVQEWADLGLMRERMNIKVGMAIVGHCDFVTQTPPFGVKAHFDGINIDEEKRGRGIGLGAYMSAIDLAHQRGVPFESQDATQTADAVKVWQRLAAARVAIVVEEFKPAANANRFEGKYIVPLSQE